MRQAYNDLLDQLGKTASPFPTLTLQYTFLLYLLLGQLVVLVLWRMVARSGSGPASYLHRLAFAAYLLAAQVLLFVAWPYLIGLWQQADDVLLADAVVTVHLGLVFAVLLGLVLVLAGWPMGWSWTRNFWMRLSQLVVIEAVAGQAVVGIECPLKTVERSLRGGPGELHNLENASAIGRWCNELLYYPGDPAVFMVVYAAVGLLVLLTWALVPPRFPWREKREAAEPGSAQRNGDGKLPETPGREAVVLTQRGSD